MKPSNLPIEFSDFLDNFTKQITQREPIDKQLLADADKLLHPEQKSDGRLLSMQVVLASVAL